MILVTGSHGQLGKSLKKVAPDFTYVNKREFDITNKQSMVEYLKQYSGPLKVLINCAAYTDVEKSETDVELAYKVNAEGVKNLSELSTQFKFRLIHISTDYVFNGKKTEPYFETCMAAPLNIYGKSKLRGENLVRELAYDYIILRTSWVFSEYNNNFVKTMLALMEQRKSLTIVSDQIGRPTYATDLAKIILTLTSKPQLKGLYQYANEGAASWFEFAEEIKDITGSSCKLSPIPTSEYPTKAERPLYSVMDTQKITNDLNIHNNHWKKGLKTCIEKISC